MENENPNNTTSTIDEKNNESIGKRSSIKSSTKTSKKTSSSSLSAEDKYNEYISNLFINALEKGTAPWSKPWSAKEMSLLAPLNPESGTKYRGNNELTLVLSNAVQGFNDNRWMTYNQAKACGGNVRTGEKGTPIVIYITEREVPVLDENGKPTLDEEGKIVTEVEELEKPIRKTSYVFNVKQINFPEGHKYNQSLTEEVTKEQEWENLQAVEDLIKNTGAKIYNDSNQAYYQPSTDSIHLPVKEAFKTQEGYYSTALHELSHWTGHSDRLNRPFTGRFGSDGYAREELVAEISSFMLCLNHGIGHNLENHASYVKSWSEDLKENRNEIITATRKAFEAQRYISSFSKKNVLDEDRTYLLVPDNDEAYKKVTELGACYDTEQKRWYITPEHDFAKFNEWLPDNKKVITAPTENNSEQIENANVIKTNEAKDPSINKDFDLTRCTEVLKGAIEFVGEASNSEDLTEEEREAWSNKMDELIDLANIVKTRLSESRVIDSTESRIVDNAESNSNSNSTSTSNSITNTSNTSSTESESKATSTIDITIPSNSEDTKIGKLYVDGKQEGRFKDLDFETFTKICDKLIIPENEAEKSMDYKAPVVDKDGNIIEDKSKWNSADLIEAIASNPVALKLTLEDEAPPMVYLEWSESGAITKEFGDNHNFLMLNDANALMKVKNMEKAELLRGGYDKSKMEILYFQQNINDHTKLDSLSYGSFRYDAGADSPDIISHIKDYCDFALSEKGSKFGYTEEDKQDIINFQNSVLPFYEKYANLPSKKNYLAELPKAYGHSGWGENDTGLSTETVEKFENSIRPVMDEYRKILADNYSKMVHGEISTKDYERKELECNQTFLDECYIRGEKLGIKNNRPAIAKIFDKQKEFLNPEIIKDRKEIGELTTIYLQGVPSVKGNLENEKVQEVLKKEEHKKDEIKKQEEERKSEEKTKSEKATKEATEIIKNTAEAIVTTAPIIATVNTYITVPYKEKNEAKALGAKWDTEQKSWYVPQGTDLNLFKKWKTHEPYKTVSVDELKSRYGLNNNVSTNKKLIDPLEKKYTHHR